MLAATPAAQYPEIEQVDNDPTDSGFDPLLTGSKFSLACDAVKASKLHAIDSTIGYFDMVLKVLGDLPVVHGRDGLFDARVLATIDKSAHTVTELRSFLELLCDSDNVEQYLPPILSFLEGVLTLKKHYRLPSHHAYLWRDSLRFVTREIFVAVVAALLAKHRWADVKVLLDHQYKVSNIERRFSYTAFDGFLRTIDVFRIRRLNLDRVSLTADLLQDRVGSSNMLFDEVIQADFILHLYSRLHQRHSLHRWIARTLCHADEQCINGFNFFITARGDNHNDCLKQLFGVSGWQALMTQAEAFCGGEDIVQNPQLLDYAGFLAKRNALFNH